MNKKAWALLFATASFLSQAGWGRGFHTEVDITPYGTSVTSIRNGRGERYVAPVVAARGFNIGINVGYGYGTGSSYAYPGGMYYPYTSYSNPYAYGGGYNGSIYGSGSTYGFGFGNNGYATINNGFGSFGGYPGGYGRQAYPCLNQGFSSGTVYPGYAGYQSTAAMPSFFPSYGYQPAAGSFNFSSGGANWNYNSYGGLGSNYSYRI